MAVAASVLVVLAIAAVGAALVARRRASAARQRLVELTVRDSLTGLPSAVALADLLGDARQRAGKAGGTAALLLFGLDHFARVNETYGPEVGDSLLRAVSDQLGAAVQPAETVMRVGGPQFAVVTSEGRDRQRVLRRAGELRRAIEIPYQIGLDQIRIDVAAAAVIDQPPDRPPGELLTDGQMALDRAADARTHEIVLFEPGLRDRLTASNAATRLQQAFDDGQFRLTYLPVIDVATDAVVGVEVVPTWIHPDRGEIAAEDYVALLEQSEVATELGWWCLAEACRQTREWTERFPDVPLLTTVRFSDRQLDQPDLAARVLATVHDAGVEPSAICLEIGKTAADLDVEVAWTALRPVKEGGVRLGLDQLGVGNSSLRYLRRFDLDVLKIDRSFVHSLGQSRPDEAIVEQVVSMAHALGIAAVADGVETQEQADALRGLRCEFAQGPWYGGPQTPEGIAATLTAGRVKPGRSG